MVDALNHGLNMQSQLNLDLHQEQRQFRDLPARTQVSVTNESAENHLPMELQLEFLPLVGAMPPSAVRGHDHAQIQYVRVVLLAR